MILFDNLYFRKYLILITFSVGCCKHKFKHDQAIRLRAQICAKYCHEKPISLTHCYLNVQRCMNEHCFLLKHDIIWSKKYKKYEYCHCYCTQRWFALKNEGEHIRQYENEVQSKIRAVLLTFTELRKKITVITVSGQNQLLLGISKTVTISVVDSEKKYVSLRNK